MRKLLMMSILFATFAVPMIGARSESAARGLLRSVLIVGAFVACYIGMLAVLQF